MAVESMLVGTVDMGRNGSGSVRHDRPIYDRLTQRCVTMRDKTFTIAFCLAFMAHFSHFSLMPARSESGPAQADPPVNEPAFAGEQAKAKAFAPDGIDAYVQRRMERDHIPGVSVAILREGKVIHCKGY